MAQLTARLSLRYLCIAILTSLAGCSGDPTGDGFKGARGDVSGTVTLDSKPLPKGCQLIFVSEAGGYTATGVVDEQGKYALNYKGSTELPACEYLVQLSAPVVVSTPKDIVDPGAMGAKLKLDRKSSKSLKTSDPFPIKYASTTTSKLKFQVAAGKNTANFELTK